jgi:hypothetical protein
MGPSKIARAVLLIGVGVAVIVAAGYLAYALKGGQARLTTTVQAAALPGMASLSGTVESPKPFKAAQVYIRSVDKRILYRWCVHVRAAIAQTDARRVRSVSR